MNRQLLSPEAGSRDIQAPAGRTSWDKVRVKAKAKVNNGLSAGKKDDGMDGREQAATRQND
ncbi:uncharacterized protein MAM_02404 [Metarhizium album ARSEF 1941]|uniref:Uncharacterized protein n=1 Tax=Metarhizium album (strain ARSEF 1941) TaxID=1081103 RepID=A0A0B2WU00_METAS|nr:uncharacterized protein MAM_02404 [Metarhizium album ARSEF 1941]KHN99551.1 hypothetical protein MAM_02404 [Metarhizium album ARSEF 1941]